MGAVGSPLITRQGFSVHARPNNEFLITRPDQNHGKLLLARFVARPRVSELARGLFAAIIQTTTCLTCGPTEVARDCGYEITTATWS